MFCGWCSPNLHTAICSLEQASGLITWPTPNSAPALRLKMPRQTNAHVYAL